MFGSQDGLVRQSHCRVVIITYDYFLKRLADLSLFQGCLHDPVS